MSTQAAALAPEETPQNPPQQAAHGGVVPQAGPGATADAADASAHGGKLLGAASPRRDHEECEAASCPMMPMDLELFVRLHQLQQHTAVPGRLRGPAAVKLEPDLLTEPHLLRDDNLLADWQRVRRGLGRVEGGARAHDRRSHDSVASAHLRPRLWLRRSSRYRLGGPGPGLPRCLCRGLHKRQHNCLQIATTSAVLEPERLDDSRTRANELDLATMCELALGRGDIEPALRVVAFVSRRHPACGAFPPREASHITLTELRDPRGARSPAVRVRATMCG